jgi:hypothetical protein
MNEFSCVLSDLMTAEKKSLKLQTIIDQLNSSCQAMLKMNFLILSLKTLHSIFALKHLEFDFELLQIQQLNTLNFKVPNFDFK